MECLPDIPGIEGRTGQGGEDQYPRTPRHPLLPVLPLLPLLMEEEGLERASREVDGTAGAFRLDRDLDPPLPILPLHRLPDLHRPCLQIDLVPGQTRCLPDPQPGGDEEHPEGMEPILPGHLEELSDLSGREGIRLMAYWPRRGDGSSVRVGNDPFFHCLAEGTAQDGMRLLHAPGREPRRQELG